MSYPEWCHISITTSVPGLLHYNDVIMSAMASQITGVSIVYSIVCSGADQRKHQSSASLAFVRGIQRWPVNSPHKGPVTRKMFSFYDVVMQTSSCKLATKKTPKSVHFCAFFGIHALITPPPPLLNNGYSVCQCMSTRHGALPADGIDAVCTMMTSSNGNNFRVTGPLCGEFTGLRWILHTKASDAELWCFLWSACE